MTKPQSILDALRPSACSSRFTNVCCGLLISVAITAFPNRTVLATPPAVEETYVNASELTRIVTQEFGAAVADDVAARVSKYLRDKPMLGHPYGPAFAALVAAGTIRIILQPAYDAAGGDKGGDRFSMFLAAVNKEPVFRGMARVRPFSGCVMVVLGLKDIEGKAALEIVSKANPYKGCRNSYWEKFQTTLYVRF